MNDMTVQGSNEDRQVIEINGIKMEVDMRTATVIENFKVGDNVKILEKKYGDTFYCNPGVIIGFDNFENLPTIAVAVLVTDYSKTEIKMVYINKASKDIEIVKALPTYMPINYTEAIRKFEKQVEDKENEIKDIKAQMNYFQTVFTGYFKDFAKQLEEEAKQLEESN